MINKTLEERLQELNTRLNQLTIQQVNINEQVTHTRREVETINTEIRSRTRRTQGTETLREGVSAVAGSGYLVGDQVIIINPSPGQENHGVVSGETRDGLLRIQPPTGKCIRRLPKNVRKNERYE